MTKLLEETIARVRKLPEDEQNSAAGALMEYLDDMRELHLSDEQLAEVRRRRTAKDRKTIPLAEAQVRFRHPGR
jgi:hypothetical protein